MCSPKGSITGSILVEVLKRIDDLGIWDGIDRTKITPFLLLDGHG